ncbi:MAG: nucleotidyltransferase domain-containing protein [Clostridiales bacterium]|nr:nucleotidyltransferase domain-containing protein [Clostridiales bacterium]
MIRNTKVDFNFVYSNIDNLKSIFSNYGDKIEVVYLFGSAYTKKINPLSDVDIAVLINDEYSEMIDEIEEEVYQDVVKCLKTDEIDLICLNKAPLSIQYGVIKNKQILYYYDKSKVVDYETKVITNYLDVKPMRDFLNHEFIKRIGV